MSLNETYSRLLGGKHLSDMFPITNGSKLRRCFIGFALNNFPLLYAIRRV